MDDAGDFTSGKARARTAKEDTVVGVEGLVLDLEEAMLCCSEVGRRWNFHGFRKFRQGLHRPPWHFYIHNLK